VYNVLETIIQFTMTYSRSKKKKKLAIDLNDPHD